MLDVDVDEAKIVVSEGTLSLGRTFREGFWPTIKAFCLENTPDAVAIEVRQEVADNKGKIVEREVGGLAHGTNDGPLFFRSLPGQLMRACGMVEAIRDA